MSENIGSPAQSDWINFINTPTPGKTQGRLYHKIKSQTLNKSLPKSTPTESKRKD